jgi:hypothetical protein
MKITNFSRGDILLFKGKDEKYKIIFGTSTYKKRSPFQYNFARTDLGRNERPIIKKVIESNFFGIGNKVNNYLSFRNGKKNVEFIS